MPWWGSGGAGSIMAAKSRDQRRKRAPNGRTVKRKTAVGVKRKVQKRAPASGVVEAALAAFAHEVRTPLTGILAISDLLATSELGERERRWADTIKAGAEHLASLANLFVDAAKSRDTSRKTGGAGSNGLREDLFNLRALARSAGDSLAGRAAAKGLQADVDISAALPVLVVGDAIRLRAALENLIDNAVKFTETGAVALAAMPVKEPGGKKKGGKISVAFAVSDSGIGLTLQEIKRLFRPFSQANVSIAARFGGAGLGLSSVKQIARMMGGDIAVTPRRGGGTTFTLTVALENAEASQGSAVQGEAHMSAAIPPLGILGVEDNPFGR